jgi:CHAT domain
MHFALIFSAVAIVAAAGIIRFLLTRRRRARRPSRPMASPEVRVTIDVGSSAIELKLRDSTGYIQAFPDMPRDALESNSRYANVTVLDPRTGEHWLSDRAIQPGELLSLRVAIGPLSASSQIEEPVPFPDHYLPSGDLAIDVVVSSTSFTVGSVPIEDTKRQGIPEQHVRTGHFVLSGDGGSARTADGASFLTFILGAPRSTGPARLRIAYYFRDAVVQSQLLTAVIGGQGAEARSGPWSLITDYTITTRLAAIVDISSRPRVAVVLNGAGVRHEAYVRTPGMLDREPEATPVNLPAKFGDEVRDLRRRLAGEPVTPTTVTQTRAQLITALRRIAPLGWDLYAAVFPGLRNVLYALDAHSVPAVLHVARPAGVTLSVPWALLYTISIDSRYSPGYEKVPVCPLVNQWDGRTLLVNGGETQCPYVGSVSHATDLLCPFGFLGFRHEIEQLNSADRPVVTINAPSGSRVVIAETAYQVDRKALQLHVAGVRQAFARLPNINVEEAVNKDLLKRLICTDLPILYFFCHGERPRADSRETFLGIGKREFLTVPDFIGWVKESHDINHVTVWDKVRPLIFVNACHSAELDSAALFNYIDAFVGAANAAGVIGTEVKISQDVAMEFARCFFDELLSPGATVGTAMHRARLAFLATGNLVGLNYTPYCWTDLTINGESREGTEV